MIIFGLACHAVLTLVILWRAVRLRKYRNWLVVTALCVVFGLCVEMVREIHVLRGVIYPVTRSRELWYRWVYFCFGAYYTEVFSHVRTLFRR